MPENLSSEWVTQERAKLLFAQARLMALTGITGILACLLLTFQVETPSREQFAWAGIVLTLTVASMILAQQLKCKEPSHQKILSLLKQHTRMVIPLGICWGMLPILGSQHVETINTPPIELLVSILVAAVAINGYGVYPSLYRRFIISIWGGMVISNWLLSQSDHLIAVIIFTAIAPILLRTAHHYAAIVKRTLDESAKAKDLVEQISQTNKELEQSKKELATSLDIISEEELVATHVFKQLVLSSTMDIDGIHSWTQPMGNLSGDLVQISIGPQQQHYIFLGDFTGHGLPAALGAVPASSVFRAMADKGLAIEDIARELNNKLNTLLPIGYFCCAAIIELSDDRSHARVWNGGLPPLIIQNCCNKSLIEYPSKNLPLGVVPDDEFLDEIEEIEFHPDERIYLYTDGLIEAEDATGDMWGKERTLNFLSNCTIPGPRVHSLRQTIIDFVNLAPPSDDVSVVEIEATPSEPDDNEVTLPLAASSQIS